MNYRNILQNTMGQESFLMVNKKLMARYDIQFAAFIAYVIDQEKYWLDKKGNNDFFIIDEDIHLFCGIKRGTILSIKKLGIESGLIKIKTKGMPLKSYYTINHKEILEVISGDNTRSDIAIESSLGEINLETVKTMKRDNLRLACKQIGVKYKGKDSKEVLLLAITDLLQLREKTVTGYGKSSELVTKKNGNEPKTDSPRTDSPKTVSKKPSYKYFSLETLEGFKGTTKSNISRHLNTTDEMILENSEYILKNKDKFDDIDRVLYSSLKKGTRYNSKTIATIKEKESKDNKNNNNVNIDLLEKLSMLDNKKDGEEVSQRDRIIEKYKNNSKGKLGIIVLRSLNLELKSLNLATYG